MFTFGFFVKVFLSAAISTWGLSFCTEPLYFKETLFGKIGYWVVNILFLVAFVCTVISLFGMIWTW